MNHPEVPRARQVRRQIVVLFLLAVLLVLGLSLAIAYRHDLFTPKAELYFVTDNANSLAPGTSVRLSGLRIGAVSDVSMQPDLTVRVTLAIRAEQFARLRADARAELVKEQLRAPALDLVAGTAAQALSAAHPEIGYRRGATLTEMADELRARLGPILDDVKQVTGMLRGRQDEMRGIIDNARSTSANLAETTAALRTLAVEARGRVATVGAELQGTVGELHQAARRSGVLLGQAEASLAAVNGTLPGLLQKADRTLDQLQGIAADGRVVSAAGAAQLPGLLRSVPPLVDDTRDLVQGARQSWPLRSLLPPPPPLLLPADSFDARAQPDAPAN
jgi:phospholipid/cholesterol/gamma-HCH transport system substrate-binding protein